MRKIIFSKTSERQLEDLLQYLELKFSVATKKKFVMKFESYVNTIFINPETFSKSQIKHGLRKCVISKQTTLYYRFNNKEIRLLSIFDTRQNPKKIKSIK